RERACELHVDGSIAKERRTGDHGVCAVAKDRGGSLDRTDAAADAAGEPAADIRDYRGVVALSFRRVEIDQLHPGKSGEPADPHFRIRRFNGELLALDELNDPAALEVDGRNQHIRTGMFRAFRYFFNSLTLVSS